MASFSVGLNGLPDDFKSVSQRQPARLIVRIERLGLLDRCLEVQVNLIEPGPLGKGEQIPFVKVQQGTARGLVNPLEDRPYLAGGLLDRGDIVAQKLVGRLRVTEAVDWFKDGEPTAWLEDAVQLVKGLLLRLHVDQDGTGRDYIHRASGNGGQILSRGADEPAALKHLHRLSKGATVV